LRFARECIFLVQTLFVKHFFAGIRKKFTVETAYDRTRSSMRGDSTPGSSPSGTKGSNSGSPVFGTPAHPVLRQLDHAGEHVDVLVRLTGGAAALAIYFHDEQLRVHLHERALALDDLGAAHVGAHFQALTDEIV